MIAVGLKRILTRWFGATAEVVSSDSFAATEGEVDDPRAVARAIEIAKRSLEGQLDPLLAARELADLMFELPTLPEELRYSFIGAASELPIGNERTYWAADALEERDRQTADFRASVEAGLNADMAALIAALEQPAAGD
jgi:hypothetical protein